MDREGLQAGGIQRRVRSVEPDKGVLTLQGLDFEQHLRGEDAFFVFVIRLFVFSFPEFVP